MQRETKTIELPFSKAKVELKTYLTNREEEKITSAYFNEKMQVNADTKNVTGLDIETVRRGDEESWRTVVVSIDGKKEGEIDIVNTIRDMRAGDARVVSREVAAVIAASSSEEKKTS